MRFFIFSAFLVFAINSSGQTASEVIKKADEKMRGKTSQASMIIKTVRPSWSREMKVKAWMKGTDWAMLLLQSPPKEKGIVFLKRKKEVWNWMPALERNIKLPPSMMSQSWMGTDFTNDDLVKESSIVNEYSHRMLADTVIDGKICYRIECIPKPETAVVWSRLLLCIDKKDFLDLYAEFYDDEGSLVNYMKAGDVKMMDGRLIPTRILMFPADKKNQRTEIIYESIRFDLEIPDNFFTLENMKKLN